MIQINPTTFRGETGKSVEVRGTTRFEIEIDGFIVRLPTLPGPPAFVSQIISRTNGPKTQEIEEIIDLDPEKSGLQITTIYTSKPTENEVLEVEGELNYQPPLTEDPNIHPRGVTITENEVRDSGGNLVQTRPDNVVGSYSVMRNGVFGREKVIHIYANYLEDSLGDRVKVPTSLVGNQLTIDILSQSAWLDTASYPVKLI